MQKLAQICIRRPVFATMLILFLVVMGLDAYRKLGVDFFPKVEFPIVMITTTLRGAAPEEVETQITKRVEEAVNTISGIDDLNSISAEGISLVSVQFALEKDPDVAAQEVRDKIAQIVSQLPNDADPPVVDKLATDASPILNIVVSSPRDLRETTKIVDDRLKKNLESLYGVGQIRFVGERRRQIQVWLDGEKLYAYSLNINQVRAALAAQNVEIPGGRLDQGLREVSVRTLGRVMRPEDFARVVVANVGGAPVRVADVADVADGVEEPRSLARLDGVPAVVMEVRKQAGTNTLQVIEGIKRRVNELRPLLPPDLKIAYARDQSNFISESFKAVQEHLILGGVFAGIIVLLFIRNWRSTLIAAVAIPTSIISTYSLMNWMGFTLNQITMLALVLVVGIVIDDAIVVLENIFRFMEEKKLSPVYAAIQGTQDIGLAVMAATLSLVIIFLPVAFMGGIVGRFMSSFGFTAAFAIMVSLLVSFTLTPMMCSRFLRPEKVASTKQTLLFRMLAGPYRAMLRWSISHRWAVVLLALLVAASSVPTFMAIGKDFLPTDDQSEFEVTVRTPPGSSLEGTDQVMREVERRLRELPGIRNLLTTIGADVRRQVDRASVIVELVPIQDRKEDQRRLMLMAREKLKGLPNLIVGVQLPSLIAGGDNRDLMFYIQGPDLARLERYSEAVKRSLAEVPGVFDLDSNYEPGKPEVRVVINRDKAADLGVDVASIATALRTLVGGDEQVTTYREGDDRYDVQLRVKKQFRDSPRAMERLFVPSTTLGNVPVANVASLDEATGPSQITRYNRQRQVMLMANIAQGQSLSNVLQVLNDKVASLNLPADYRTGLVGRSREFGRAALNYALAFLLSIVLMYMVLAAQFESFIDPVTILMSLPLSVPFALLSLLLARENFSIIYSSVGILVLFGIVKKNAILQIDHIKSLRNNDGLPRMEAILHGCEDRLRPILMTTASLVAGMVPMALGGGAGSGSRRTVAIVVIGGQSLCLLLTLLVTPVVYSLFDDVAHWAWRRRLAVLFSRGGLVLRRAWTSLFCLAVLLIPPSLPGQEQRPARVGVGVTQTKLSLIDALERALRNNLDIEITRTNMANSQQFLTAARGAFDPLIRWQPLAALRQTPTSSLLAGVGGKIDDRVAGGDFQLLQRFPWQGSWFQVGFENNRQSTNNAFVSLNPWLTTRFSATFQMPLVRGRTIDRERAEVEIRNKQVDISQTDFVLRVIDIISQTEQAYWNLSAAREDVQVKTDSVSLAREQVARAQRMIDSGTLAPVELAAAEAELERRMDTWYASVGLVTEVENVLKAMITPSREDPLWRDEIVPTEEQKARSAEVAELEEAVLTALRRRPELRQLELAAATNDVQKRLAANQVRPQVSLVAGYASAGLAGTVSDRPNPFESLNRLLYDRVNTLSNLNGLAPLSPPSLGTLPPGLIGGYGKALSSLFNSRYPSVQIGLNLEWNPRNRAAEAGYEQSLIAEKRLKLERSRVEQLVEAQVRNALQAIHTARQRIAAAEASADAARVKLESETRLFQSGESTNFLVLTRQNEYADSRHRAVVARLDFNKALARFRQALGTTLETHRLQVR